MAKGPTKNNIVLYVAVAAIIIIAVALYSYYALNPNYSVSVHLKLLNPQQKLYPFQISKFQISLNNTGSSKITGITVGFYLNNTQLDSKTITNLAPGKGIVINESYQYQSTGQLQIKAVADPSNLLKVVNPSSAQSAIELNVSQQQAPNVYTSIPNTNINSTQSFSFSPYGFGTVGYLSTTYNIPIFDQMYANNNAIVTSIFYNLLRGINLINGAYTTYSNSTNIYAVWFAGPVNASTVNVIVSSFKIPQSAFTLNGEQIHYAKVSNQTSMCYFYDQGWTKLFQYYNASASPTCKNILNNTYQPVETLLISNALKANQGMKRIRGIFNYTNSSQLGSSIFYKNSQNGSIASLNLSVTHSANNASIAYFASYIKRNQPPMNVNSFNATCLGLVYSIRNTIICSKVMPSSLGNYGAAYILLNSTEVTVNYTATLYSLVNYTLVSAAHIGAAYLISTLNLSGAVAQWNTPFKNSCAMSKLYSSLSCAVFSHNVFNGTVRVNVTNNYKSAIHINTASCYLPGARYNQSINTTVAGGATTQIGVLCRAISTGGGFSLVSSYVLSLNYTYAVNGTTTFANGVLNVTNQ